VTGEYGGGNNLAARQAPSPLDGFGFRLMPFGALRVKLEVHRNKKF